MHKIIKTIFLSFVVFGVFNTKAQEEISLSRYNGFGGIKDNWFIELGVGGQVLFATDASLRVPYERITPHISLSCGKWISPFIGVRLQFQSYQLNGAASSKGIYTANRVLGNNIFGNDDPVRDYVKIKPDGSYAQNIYYLNMHFDLQISIMSLIHKGYSESDKWDAIPSIGIGYMHVFEKNGIPAEDMLSANFSIMGKYRINSYFDVNLEVQSAVFPDQFEGRITGKTNESNFAFSAGVTYNFGKKKFNQLVGNHSVVEVQEPVDERIIDTVYIEKVVEVVKVERDTVKIEPQEYSITSILFSIGDDTPKYDVTLNYCDVANFLEQNPNKKIRLDAYSDKETGSLSRNMEISKKRIQFIKNILVKKYKVKESQLIENPIGSGGKQPYNKNKLNRVVVCTVIME